MKNKITIISQKEIDTGWRVEVDVDKMSYFATLNKDYLEKFGREGELPMDFVRRSFEFLLARESKESIMRTFNVKVIQRYFPEYEREISE